MENDATKFQRINARCETVDTKPSFRHLVNNKRCIVIVDGFYEWKKTGDKKQPYFVYMGDKNGCTDTFPLSIDNESQPLLLLGGLWDKKIMDGDESFSTCTILTTTPTREFAR